MNDWSKRLYDGYVSTGQSTAPVDSASFDNPYNDALIKKHLPKNVDINILDLACGNGRLLYSLKKNGFNNLTGVDVSLEQIEFAKKTGVDQIECKDLRGFLDDVPAESFHVIFMMDIIEHFNHGDVLEILDKVNRALKKNGMLVIHVPNGDGIFGMGVRYGDFTHVHALTPKSTQQILSSCGFSKITSYEDKPTIHGLKSLIRYVLWQVLTLPVRLLYLAETGSTKQILSRNMLAVARKS
jgi:2-polyprenyl-3-methyl-5-hydroxy-6-metoxy-1,4-benzoquinol methylase